MSLVEHSGSGGADDGALAPHRPVNLAVFVSGRGSNLQALVDSCESGELAGLARVTYVVSSSADAAALAIARRAGIDTALYPVDIDLAELLAQLKRREIEYIALAGYLRLIEPELVRAFRGRMVNIHPSLAPKYTGKGMYGLRIHRAVIKAGEKESGVTVHLVDEDYDSGEVLAQERVAVKPDDTPEDLAERALAVEHNLFPATLAKLIRTQQEAR